MTTSSLKCVLRVAPERVGKRRPSYFTQLSALQTLKAALEQVNGDLIVVEDGELAEEVSDLLQFAQVRIRLGGVGNRRSMLKVLDIVGLLPPDQLIYLAEDDYIYSRNAFCRAIELSSSPLWRPKSTFFSLFDHPDRYRRMDDALREISIARVGDQHWRTSESTCMSFGCHAVALQKYSRIFRLASTTEQTQSRYAWRAMTAGRILPLLTRGLLRDRPTLARSGVGLATLALSHQLDRSVALWSPIPGLANHAAVGANDTDHRWIRVASMSETTP